MCEICKRIELIKQGKEKYFIKEYETGYLSLFDNQAYPGYCLFIYKKHKEEFWQTFVLDRDNYFSELSEIGHKLEMLYKPRKMNYCFLGNGEKSRHLHCHIIPNNIPNRTIWHNNNYKENFDYNIKDVVNKIRGVL